MDLDTRTRRLPTLSTVWGTAAWTTLLVLTALNGLVVGYGVIWFQLMGSQPDRSDYLVSAGGYGAAGVALVMGAAALIAYDGPRIVTAIAGPIGFLYVLLAVSSFREAATAEDIGFASGTVWDGVGAVWLMPWTWPLLVLGVAAGVTSVRRTLIRARG